jgi:DNA polymerase-3 subunit chi
MGCQVDFYVLGDAALAPEGLACRLAAMAWERGHAVTLVTADARAAEAMDERLWSSPPGRFLPHEISEDARATRAPIRICTAGALDEGEVVINLCPQPVPEPGRFARLLEFVPFEAAERAASRARFTAYRKAGLNPATHTISK